jgi:Bacterial extracellular solute-binding proteins, family 3
VTQQSIHANAPVAEPAVTKRMNLMQLTFIVAVNMMGSGIIMLPTNMAQVGAISLLSWTERAKAFDIAARIVPVDSYDSGVQRMIDGTANVLFGDRAILLEAAKRNPAARSLILLDRRFINEPVALVLRRGDEDFRLAIDQKLSQLMRSDAFRGIYARSFGEFDQSSARFFRDTVLPD